MRLAVTVSSSQSLWKFARHLVYRYYAYFSSFFESFISCNFQTIYESKHFFPSAQTVWIDKLLYPLLQLRRENMNVKSKTFFFSGLSNFMHRKAVFSNRISFWIFHNLSRQTTQEDNLPPPPHSSPRFSPFPS